MVILELKKKHMTLVNIGTPQDIQELQNLSKGNVENKRPSIIKPSKFENITNLSLFLP
jgi:hypothetical protein